MRRNKNTELRIRQAFVHAAPDILDSVLSDCETQKGRVILMTEGKKKRHWLQGAVTAAVILAVVLVGAAGMNVYSGSHAVASIISLDVNPSIEIKVNRKERVLEVNALNEDGRAVIGDMDFEGSSLEVAVNALIGSMLQGGYLSELANSILISVDSKDPQAGAALQEKLAREARELLRTDSFSGAVVSQTVAADAQLQSLAADFGITEGKAQLIRQLTEKLPVYSFEDLVSLSINELNLLMESAGSPEWVRNVGMASDKAYIGADKALEKALAYAGAGMQTVRDVEAELGLENGVMVYEVDFKWEGWEYEYDIDAVTGELLKDKKEPDDDWLRGQAGNQAAGNGGGTAEGAAGTGTAGGAAGAGTAGNTCYIGEEKAREIALTHAGAGESSVTGLRSWLDYDDGFSIYEIEFRWGGYEYDYDIDAVSGTVVKHDKEREAGVNTGISGSGTDGTGGAANGANASYMGVDKARQTALALAGLKESDISDYQVELERENGMEVYEIEFKSGGYEYHYELDAVTGSLVGEKKEIDD